MAITLEEAEKKMLEVYEKKPESILNIYSEKMKEPVSIDVQVKLDECKKYSKTSFLSNEIKNKSKSAGRPKLLDKEKILEVAKSFFSLKDFRTTHRNAYDFAHRNGFAKELKLVITKNKTR